jgi:peptidoglycan/LPS O-acetylase OafA/YrhL
MRTDIEALRGVAILAVVAFHCRVPAISGGFVGVDIFYVLSGYLITGLLVAEADCRSRIDLLQFYSRRVRRLLPASALMLLVTLLAGTVLMAPQELSFAARAARATSLYISNMFFAADAADYFGMRVASNPLLHTWSLAVEEQFYLFWPLLIMLGLLVLRSKRALTYLLIGLTVASLVASVWLTSHHTAFAFYALPSRAWEFGVGGLAALLPVGALKLSRGFWLILGWTGTVLLLGACLLISSASSFPGWIATLPVLATAAILIAGAEQPHRGVGKVFDIAPLQRIGNLSYSWYLWHWPFLVFAAVLFPAVTTVGKLVAVAAALVIAYLTNRFIENPIRFNAYLVKHPAGSLSLGGGLAAACLLAAVLSLHFADHLATEPGMKQLMAAHDDVAPISRQDCVSRDGSAEIKICSFGATESPVTVVLFGDSHALQWFGAVRDVAATHHWALRTIVKLGCAAVDVTGGRGFDPDPECAQWRDAAIRRIILLHPQLVVMGNATNHLGRPDDPTTRAGPAFISEIHDGMLHTLQPLSRAHVPMLLIRDTPEFPFDVTICLQRSLRHSWYPADSCDMSRALVLDPAIFIAEESAISDLRNVHFVDMTDQLCQHDVCKAVENHTVIYRDSHHLTSRFTEGLAPLLAPELTAALRHLPANSYAGTPASN